MDIESKISNIIDECFTKLREAFEEKGLELDYEQQDYVEELILNQLDIEISKKD